MMYGFLTAFRVRVSGGDMDHVCCLHEVIVHTNCENRRTTKRNPGVGRNERWLNEGGVGEDDHNPG